MTTRRMAATANFFLAPAGISLAYGVEGYWLVILIALGLGAGGWMAWNRRASFWNTNAYFGVTLALLTLGAFFKLMPFILVFTILFALTGWDLLRFLERIDHTTTSESFVEIERQHLLRLGTALLGGGVLGGIALNLQLQISFGFALLLAGILIVSLGQFIRLLRN